MSNENRRKFISNAFMFSLSLPSLVSLSKSCLAQSGQHKPVVLIGGGCDGCDIIYEGMPDRLTNIANITSSSEPGERMDINGVIYQVDGKTPAKDVILYVYHTDATGYYSKSANQLEGRRHGRLRSWLKTNSNGEYKFATIKPAPYPGREIPSHIHPVIKEPGKNEYYIDEYVFDNDPLLTRKERDKCENRGGSGIMHMSKNKSGLWTGTRNIILGRNIPSYK